MIIYLREAYEAILTSRLNQIIKILTFLTVILSVRTIIASIYGMNLKLPLEDRFYRDH